MDQNNQKSEIPQEKKGWGSRIRKLLNVCYLLGFIIFLGFSSQYLLRGFLSLIEVEVKNNSIEFVKYLISLAFTLAGFTFLTSSLIDNKKEKTTKIELDFLNISYFFILSGFIGLLYIALFFFPSITPDGQPVEDYLFVKDILLPVSMGMTIVFFLTGLLILLIDLMVELPRLKKKYEKDFPVKMSIRESLKEILWDN